MAQQLSPVAYVRANDGTKFRSDLETLRVFAPIAGYAASLELPYAQTLAKDSEPLEFQFSELDSRTLEHLIRWAELRQRKGLLEQDAEPQVDPVTRERHLMDLSPEEQQFVSVPTMQELLGLLRASDYTGLQSLYNYACAEVARRIAGKPPAALRQLFGLPGNLAPKNAETLRKRNRFCRY